MGRRTVIHTTHSTTSLIGGRTAERSYPGSRDAERLCALVQPPALRRTERSASRSQGCRALPRTPPFLRQDASGCRARVARLQVVVGYRLSMAWAAARL